MVNPCGSLHSPPFRSVRARDSSGRDFHPRVQLRARRCHSLLLNSSDISHRTCLFGVASLRFRLQTHHLQLDWQSSTFATSTTPSTGLLSSGAIWTFKSPWATYLPPDSIWAISPATVCIYSHSWTEDPDGALDELASLELSGGFPWPRL